MPMNRKHFFMYDQAPSAVSSFMSECPEPPIAECSPAGEVSSEFTGTGVAVVVAVLTLLNLIAVVPST